MNKSSSKMWGMIAGGIMLAITAISAFSLIRNYIQVDSLYRPPFLQVYWSSVIGWILSVLFAVSLLTDNLNMAKIVAILKLVFSGVSLVVVVAAAISQPDYIIPALVIISNILSVAANVLILMALLNRGKMGLLFCIVSVAAGLLSSLVSMLGYRSPFGPAIVSALTTGLFSAAQYVPLGLYLAGKDTAVAATAGRAPARAPADNRSSIEKLSALKRLLDSGAISQEEFDEKKRQVLGQ